MPGSRSSTLALAVRFTIGLVWIAGALFNLTWTLRHPSALTDALSTDATFPIFRWFFGEIVPHASGLWIAALVLVELTLGVLTLSRGAWARAGLVGSAALSLFLFPIIWPYTLMMGGWALLALWLLRADSTLAITDIVRPGLHLGRHATGRRA